MAASTTPSRRAVLHAVAGTAVVGAVAGCGARQPTGGPVGGPPSSGPVGDATDVPVGGGTVFAEARVVVTQPTEGQFKGFWTRCPHQGCAVSSVADGFIVCPCHGSRFAVATGEPTADSPARQALSAVVVSVRAGEVVVG